MRNARRARTLARTRCVRSALVVVALGALGVAAAGCGGSGDTGDTGDAGDAGVSTSAGALDAPVEVAPLPPVQQTAATSISTTVAPPTSITSPVTVASTTGTIGTTATTAATIATIATTATTAAPPGAVAPPCDIERIVAETGTDYEAITPEDLRCVDVWATWIGRPDDQFADGFFAVGFWTGTSWELANLGTAGICADAGVPDALWQQLGCFE